MAHALIVDDDAPVGVDERVSRARITVARLANRARVDQMTAAVVDKRDIQRPRVFQRGQHKLIAVETIADLHMRVPK